MTRLIAIVGATGTGKSSLALDLAETITASGGHAEIVNADAMQQYRGMDIGTAKVPQAERRGIPHHLFDELDVTEEASVARYQAAARAAISDISRRGATPILVGGSGLYVSSVVYDYAFPGTDPVIRQRLEGELTAEGPGMMHRRLDAVDPGAAAAIGPHNGRRLVRALEVVEMTGESFGSGLPDESDYWMPTVTVGLTAERPTLVERLDERVVGMWRDGLLDEVGQLLERGLASGVTASRAIGYAQAAAELRGELRRDEAIAATQALTRRYARRQVGWFRRYPATRWLDHDRPDLADTVMAMLRPDDHSHGSPDKRAGGPTGTRTGEPTAGGSADAAADGP
ncbi:tRNA (adenosine(37)-N6)-dimethylallyltransferase MiaA [Marisediminicola senii]|uniref:tRNA (adenosine(37)-N6)-dimethylallyltransferase MiaA n=1 Tax=Marisediminicola senii TaxID=2711233 RepID=UPI0013EDC45A|nr:tRNA (adenosine(37)-N6)-dimethylallyltransferase MiaA [Marisediminicola senii]